MTHLKNPSLMSRLFPQDDRPADHLPSSEDLSSSTLFARVSSPGLFSTNKTPFVSSSSRDEQLRPNNLFHACLATFRDDAAKHKAQVDKTAGGALLAQLREAFAQEGVGLHASVVDKLAGAQRDIASKISDFSTLSTSIASDIDDLYANISSPLSTTRCHSKDFPRANIEAQLSIVKEQLAEAENELRQLESDWQENLRLEEKLRQEMLDMERGPGRNGEVGHGDGANSKMTNFKEELERIVEEHTQALNDIEEEYKEEVQHQTMKMMQAMLVD